MNSAFVVEAVRSPMGRARRDGALSGLHPVDLLSQIIAGLVARSGIDPGMVDDVIVGCVSQSSEQSNTIGRMSWLAAGFPEHVPSVTVERKCGSGQQAIHFAVQGVMSGQYDLVIAAGVESMSRVPMGSNRQGADLFGSAVADRYSPGLLPQGVAAELIANKWGLDRRTLDEFAVRSHRLASEASDAGAFAREIIAITTPDGGIFDRDETIRAGTTVERISALPTVFRTDEYAERFPDVDWRVSSASSSQLTDGASAVLIASSAMAEKLGLRTRGVVRGMSVCGDDPVLMLTAPIPATRKVLERTGLRIDEIDHFEVNEAFAPVPLAWTAELGADPAKLNPRGGAIALGHPLGATGVRLFTTMLHALEDTGGRLGLQTVCEAGGQANALILERPGA